jgi:hypothetical protein
MSLTRLAVSWENLPMQLQDIVSWTAIGWIIAVLLGVWGVMIGIGRHTFAHVLAIIGGLGFLLKLIADLRLTHPFVLIPALVCTAALEVAAYYWTRSLAREAASETAKQRTFQDQLNTVPKLQEQLETLREESINTLTGGDTFCYITLTPALMGTSGMDAIRVGKYPLREVVATTHKSLDIFFRALNGTWLEYFRLRRVNEKWVKAIWINGDRARHFEKIDDDYPKEDGQPVDLPHRVTSASPRDGEETEPKE